MNFQSKKLADFLVLLGLFIFCCWYLRDAWNASSSAQNLILILPISVATLLLCVIEFVRQCLDDSDDSESTGNEPSLTPILVIALFAAYVISLEFLGFDLGTVLFVGLFLFFQGEKRIPWLLGYSLVFGFLVALFFSQMLPYPMPMMFLPTDY